MRPSPTAAAESDCARSAARRSTLSWTPPAGAAPTSVSARSGLGAGCGEPRRVRRLPGRRPPSDVHGVPVGHVFRARAQRSAAASERAVERGRRLSSGAAVRRAATAVQLTSAVNGRIVTLSWELPATRSGRRCFGSKRAVRPARRTSRCSDLDASLRRSACRRRPARTSCACAPRMPCGTSAASNEIVVTVSELVDRRASLALRFAARVTSTVATTVATRPEVEQRAY